MKIAALAWVLILIPAYEHTFGLANFLWFSDVALFLTVAALLLESPLLTSMAAISVLPLEIVWNIEFFIGLFGGPRSLNLAGYMFDSRYPLFVRLLSFFHLWLPPLWIWMLLRLGFVPRAWRRQTVLSWTILLLTYGFTDPAHNINWVFGPGAAPQHRLPALAYLLVLMIFFPVVIYLPTTCVLKRFFPNHGGD